MHSLKGHVSILSFTDLIQLLVSNQRIGTLTLSQASEQKIIHLAEDGMRLLATTTHRTNSLGEILLRTKKVTRAAIEELLDEQRKTGVRFGEIVRKRGLINHADLMNALRQQAEEEIYDLFLWTDAAFDFSEGAPPDPSTTSPFAAVVVDSTPASVMLEAARRADELEVIMRVVRDERLIPIKTPKPLNPRNLGIDIDLINAVYRAANGKLSVNEVIRLSLYPRFNALRALYVLTKQGYLKLLDEKGATAFFRVGGDTRRVPAPPAAAAAASAAPAVAKRTLMLLGDLLTYRNALATLLRSGGYEVIEEASASAINLFRGDRKVDCVILDISLDNPEGYEFCKWVGENMHVPVIVLSSDPGDEAVKNAMSAGAGAYIVKPFTRDRILKSLAEVLSKSPPKLPPIRKKEDTVVPPPLSIKPLSKVTAPPVFPPQTSGIRTPPSN